MTDSATIDDPIRERVEATIRRTIDDLTALPCQVVRAARDRVAQPVAMVRSVVTLAVDGVLGKPHRSAPSPETSTTPPRRTRPAGGGQAVPGDAAARPSSNALPIADYESLAASQVVDRLERLSIAELDLVAAFERAHRGRRTVLGKIEQLTAAAP